MAHLRWIVFILLSTQTLLLSAFFYYTHLFPTIIANYTYAIYLIIGAFIGFFLVLYFYIYRHIFLIKELLIPFRKKIDDPSRVRNQYDFNPLKSIKFEVKDFAKRKQQEIESLQKLESFRREFLADVSHELKTPIFAAQGFIDTLMDGAMDDTEVRDRFLNKAANSLERLNVLVHDLITISQLEIGEIKMNFQHFDIKKVAEEIFDQFEELSQKKNIRLRFHKNNPKSCYVYGDKFRLGQVLNNLISNAIKYGRPNGMVEVSFTYEINDIILISIKDDGPGIEETHLNRIFERFYRIEKSRNKDEGGSGLGLSIVKHILEAHESKISVESIVGQGTTFQFRLKKGKVINEKG